MGNLKEDMNDYKGAGKAYSTAIRLAPASSDGYSAIASMNSEEEKYPAAISYYSKAIKCDATNSRLYYLRGMSNYKYGNFSATLKDLSDAIRLDSLNIKAYEMRAKLYSQMELQVSSMSDIALAEKLKKNKDCECSEPAGIKTYFKFELDK